MMMYGEKEVQKDDTQSKVSINFALAHLQSAGQLRQDHQGGPLLRCYVEMDCRLCCVMHKFASQ